jgi:hypothetical protein
MFKRAGTMPKDRADRTIMFCVIGLVAWAIIGLPALRLFWTAYDPAHHQSGQPPGSSSKTEDPWLTKDAAGFFTFLLVVVGAFQVGLFLWQLWLIRESLDDAKIAAEAAKEAADTAKIQAETAQATLRAMQESNESARDMAQAAILNARAAVRVQLPVITISRCNLWQTEAPLQSNAIVAGPNITLPFVRPSFTFYNFGRSVAEVVSVCWEIDVADRLKPPPKYSRILPNAPGVFVQANGGTVPMEFRNAGIEINQEQRAAIAARIKSLWLYGFLRYRDFMSDPHEYRFCVRWAHQGEGPDGFFADSDAPEEYTRSS